MGGVLQRSLGVHDGVLRTQPWGHGVNQGSDGRPVVPVPGEVGHLPVRQLLLHMRGREGREGWGGGAWRGREWVNKNAALETY